MKATLKHLGNQIKDHRKQKGYSQYYAASICEMGSHTGLRHLEEGDETRLSTLLKASKGLGLRFIIEDGIIKRL